MSISVIVTTLERCVTKCREPARVLDVAEAGLDQDVRKVSVTGINTFVVTVTNSFTLIQAVSKAELIFAHPFPLRINNEKSSFHTVIPFCSLFF